MDDINSQAIAGTLMLAVSHRSFGDERKRVVVCCSWPCRSWFGRTARPWLCSISHTYGFWQRCWAVVGYRPRCCKWTLARRRRSGRSRSAVFPQFRSGRTARCDVLHDITITFRRLVK